MIPSNEPITYPARGASTFAEMKIVRITSKIEDGKTQVVAVLQNFNDSTQELDPERHTFAIHIDDLEVASQATRRIAKILDDLNEVVALVYNVQFIEHQVDQAETDEEDTTQLRVDLQTAREALNADPDVASVR